MLSTQGPHSCWRAKDGIEAVKQSERGRPKPLGVVGRINCRGEMKAGWMAQLVNKLYSWVADEMLNVQFLPNHRAC